jgi:hypothetical protein
MDQRVRKWLYYHDPVQGVFDTVEMSAGLSPEELGRILTALCDDAMKFLETRPDRLEVLAHNSPRSPESEALWKRLVALHRARRTAAA